MSIDALKKTIEQHFNARESLSPNNKPNVLKNALDQVIEGLNDGALRVASSDNDGNWHTHAWLKQAILLFFQTTANQPIENPLMPFFDKVPMRWDNDFDMHQAGVRIVPGALARTGTYIGKSTVLMPSYVNIGAFIDEGCMIDTWATVGSCAQIGKNVHISGGAGIGGVLEPLQANPTIIEDDCFIGARSEVVEGVIVKQGAVLSMGVHIGQSTKIYDRTTGKIHFGVVPKDAVVVPGSLPSADGSHSVACAVIVKYADKATRDKVGINALLRDT